MGRLLMRAVQAAGLSDIAERVLAGEGLGSADMERLRHADLLLVVGLADLAREKFRGDEVRVFTNGTPRDPSIVVVDLAVDLAAASSGLTGTEILLEVARERLRTPSDRALAVSLERLGVELAQTALCFGADVLYGDLAGKSTLPLLDGVQARREELGGLVERSGRRVRFMDAESESLEQHS